MGNIPCDIFNFEVGYVKLFLLMLNPKSYLALKVQFHFSNLGKAFANETI